jgi:hypothetical protein
VTGAVPLLNCALESALQVRKCTSLSFQELSSGCIGPQGQHTTDELILISDTKYKHSKHCVSRQPNKPPELSDVTARVWTGVEAHQSSGQPSH